MQGGRQVSFDRCRAADARRCMKLSLERVRARLTAIVSGRFVRSAGMLAIGTAVSQLLMVLVLPVLTRLYNPEHFTVLAVYASLLAILSVAACARLEIAIPVPDSQDEAIGLLILALISATVVGLALGSAVWLYPEGVLSVTQQPHMRPYLWMLPLGVWLAGSYAALQYWATRREKYEIITRTRVSRAVGAVAAQTGMGWAGYAPVGLLVGHLISVGAGVYGLARIPWAERRNGAARLPNFRYLLATLKKYQSYPKYSVFESLANTAGVQLPVLIIAALAPAGEAGFLMLNMRVLHGPLALVGAAVAMPFLSRAGAEHRAGTLGVFTSKVVVGLLNTGVGPLVFAAIVAPIAFPLLFGEQWRRAGELVVWMAPWFALQFVSSPISMSMHVIGRQREMMLLTLFGSTARVCGTWWAASAGLSGLVEAYAVSAAVFYLSLTLVVAWHAGFLNAKTFLSPGTLGILGGWVALGFGVRTLLINLT